MDYLIIFLFVFLICISFMGYGLLIANYINKDLLKINIGYIGLFGLLACTIISYITIYITNHGYTHNIFLHLIGISSFFYFFYKKKMEFKFSYFLLIFILLFIGLLIIRNHDDFSYYHLTYSLGLTEEKLILGLGNLGNRYNKHSSIFFLNSIIYLPIIKYYLFHSTGWITLLFINFIFLDKILFDSKKNLDCEFYISLLFFLFINYKFFRIGGYGTDVSGQIIVLSILPLILKLYNFDKVKEISKNNLSIIILLISYASTIKSFLILNFLYLVPLLYFTKAKNIKAIIIPKVYAISFLTIFLLASINISYSGCAIYPVKTTCFENQLEWSLKKDHVSNQNKWYQQWSKSGAGINYRTLSPEQYIKKLNWVPNWYERYFKYKFKETLLGVIFLSLLVIFLFNSNKNKVTKPSNGIKRSSLITIAISFVLFLEWFWHHPALRYGGYYLLVTLMFMPISIFLSRKSINFNKKYSMIIFLIFLSYSLFNLKNFTRIKEEMKIVKNNNFPFFYSKDQKSNRVNIGNNVFIYIPLNEDGCWISKTPCAGRSDHVLGKKIGPYKAIIKKF
jgi:hypothetical protein